MACLPRWGSHVSTKLFMAKQFVIKHIHSKHEEKVLAEKEKVRSMGPSLHGILV